MLPRDTQGPARPALWRRRSTERCLLAPGFGSCAFVPPAASDAGARHAGAVMLPGPARLCFRWVSARCQLWPHPRRCDAARPPPAAAHRVRARAQGGALVVGDLEFKVAGDDSSLWTRGALPKGTTRKCAPAAARPLRVGPA